MNALLEAPPREVRTDAAPRHGRVRRMIAVAGLSVYAGGLLTAMLWSFFASGDWFTGLLTIPHALLAGLFAGGAMAMALLYPDPYVGEHGEPPARLPDFD